MAFPKKKVKAGVQKEAFEAGDGGAPDPATVAKRPPFVKAKTNNFKPKGRGGKFGK